MPEQSEAQILGDAGELWFQTQLPPAWIPQRPTKDVGVDFVVVICEPGPLNGREFRIQVKTLRQFQVIENSIVISGVKRSTIDYWFISPVPTMVVAYDHSQRRGFYTWHNDLFQQVARLQADTTVQTVSLKIPTEQALDTSSWSQIRQALLWHHRNLRMALHAARDARSVLPTIHRIAGAARQLTSIDHQPIPESERTPQQEGLLALLEMIQHRDVIKAASQILSEVAPGSDGAMRLGTWIDEYRAEVVSAFPTFDQLPQGDRIPLDFELVYTRNLVHRVRPRLLQRALELIMLLTPSGAAGAATEDDVPGEG